MYNAYERMEKVGKKGVGGVRSETEERGKQVPETSET